MMACAGNHLPGWRRAIAFQGGDELVTSPSNGCDVLHGRIKFGQRASKVADIDLQVMVVDDIIWPYMRKQIGFADNLARPRHEQGQNVETSPTEADGLPLVQEGLSFWQKTEISNWKAVCFDNVCNPRSCDTLLSQFKNLTIYRAGQFSRRMEKGCTAGWLKMKVAASSQIFDGVEDRLARSKSLHDKVGANPHQRHFWPRRACRIRR